MAKCDEVLNTPELLELILARLPMKDLLLAQRVCKSFNTIIDSSPTLQQALFFRPLPATAVPKPSRSTKLRSYPGDRPTTEPWERNPLLISAFWPWFERSTPHSKFGAPFWGPEVFESLPLAATPQGFAFLRPKASWRRMLLTQPPIAELQIMLITHSRIGDSIVDASICPGNALRMGVVYDVTCQELLGSRTRTLRGFRMQWHGADKRLVLLVKRTTQCTVGRDYSDPAWKRYYSGACEGITFEWRTRELDQSTPHTSYRVGGDIMKAGDYEVED